MNTWKIKSGDTVTYGGGTEVIPTISDDMVPSSGTKLYYVAKWGSDTTGNGSRNMPFLTIDKAVDTGVGDIIIVVGSGIYTENLTRTAAGSYIRFYADGDVFLNGSGGSLYASVNYQDVSFSGFHIDNYNYIFDILISTNSSTFLYNCVITRCNYINKWTPGTPGASLIPSSYKKNVIYGATSSYTITQMRDLVSYSFEYNTFINCNILLYNSSNNIRRNNIFKNCNMYWYNGSTSLIEAHTYICFFQNNYKFGGSVPSLVELSTVYPSIPSGFSQYGSISAISSAYNTAFSKTATFTQSYVADPQIYGETSSNFTLKSTSPIKNSASNGFAIGGRDVGTFVKFDYYGPSSSFDFTTATGLTGIDNGEMDYLRLTSTTTKGSIKSSVMDIGEYQEFTTLELNATYSYNNGQFITPFDDFDGTDITVPSVIVNDVLETDTTYYVQPGENIIYDGISYAPTTNFTTYKNLVGLTYSSYSTNFVRNGNYLYLATTSRTYNHTNVGGSTYAKVIRLHYDGTNKDGYLDTSWAVNASNATSGSDLNIAVQNDGKVVTVGNFSTYNSLSRNRICRLNTDGSVEDLSTFNVGTGFNYAADGYRVGIQSTGHIVIFGPFSTYNGYARNSSIRLNSNGTTASMVGGAGFSNYLVSGFKKILVLSDDSILVLKVVSDSYSYNGVTKTSTLWKFNSDLSLDTTFMNNMTATNTGIEDISVQTDGKILLCGSFASINGTSVSKIARLNSNGTIDTGWAINNNSSLSANAGVNKIYQQSNGKIVIAGYFTQVATSPRNYIARLNSDGTLDNSYLCGNGFTFYNGSTGIYTNTPSSTIRDTYVVAGDDILFCLNRYSDGSYINNVYDGSMLRTNIVKIKSDGTLDSSFNKGSGATSPFGSGTVQKLQYRTNQQKVKMRCSQFPFVASDPSPSWFTYVVGEKPTMNTNTNTESGTQISGNGDLTFVKSTALPVKGRYVQFDVIIQNGNIM